MKLPSIATKKDLKGKRVLLRLDLNVPIKNGRVVDDFRIRQSLRTINYLSSRGAKVVIVSHIGRSGESLKPVHRKLAQYIKVGFLPGTIGEKTEKIVKEMKNGNVVLLENLRRHNGEEKGDIRFAALLGRLADIYVNDAFAASHRGHASIALVPKLIPGYAGFLLLDEVKHLEELSHPQKPFLFVLGGAKFETKTPLVKKFIRRANTLFIGGAMSNTFFRAKGFEIGKSLADTPKSISGLLSKKNIILPEDVIVLRKKKSLVLLPTEVLPTDLIVDIGPKSVKKLISLIDSSCTVLLNGPLGNYELGFSSSTEGALLAMANKKTYSIVGGGDTTLLVARLKLEKKLTFLSTGGGAMVEFLANGDLPGLKALR